MIPATNTYTQEVTVTYQNDPGTGSLEVNGQFFSITGSPQTVLLTGLVANGNDVAATARFTTKPECNFTIIDLFIAPEECETTCNILALFAGQQSDCDPGTNTYTQEVIVAYQNPPGTGDLRVNGQSFAITNSPQTVTLLGLLANGGVVNTTAHFSADSTCVFTENNLFIAPLDCIPNEIPIAINDTISTDMNLSIIAEVLTNDTDGDGILNPQSVQIVDGPQNGIASVNQDGTITYTPDMDFNGTDAITYTVSDDQGAISNLATLIITVDLVTALFPLIDPGLQQVTIQVLPRFVQVTIDQTRIKKLAIDLVDLNGHIIEHAVYLGNFKDEYILNIPNTYVDNLLLISIRTNQGKFTKKFIAKR